MGGNFSLISGTFLICGNGKEGQKAMEGLSPPILSFTAGIRIRNL